MCDSTFENEAQWNFSPPQKWSSCYCEFQQQYKYFSFDNTNILDYWQKYDTFNILFKLFKPVMFLNKRHDFWKIGIKHKLYILISSEIFVLNNFHSKKNKTSYDQKRRLVFM
jgi:hypothetical protein